MDGNDTECALCLCNIPLKTLEFNLKNKSRYSNIPLVSMIENIIGNEQFFTINFEICSQCHDLLNELDAIEVRRTEIQNQFKKYFGETKRNICATEELPQNISLSECSDIKSDNDNSSELLTAVSDLKSDEISNVEEIAKPSAKRKKHSDVAKLHKCHCSKQFRTLGELKNHMNSHNDQRAYICEICGQSYKHKAAFNIHMDMHKRINPFTCIYCNKSFTQKGALVRHTPIHTGEMPYQCDECGKRFVHHTSFNVHRLTHTGLKSYKCTLCGLALMSTSHLKRHMRIHTGEKKFVCNTCGKRFAEKYNLAVHEKLHNNPCMSVSQKRNYNCQICGLNFKRKVKLDEHLMKDHQIVGTNLDNRAVLKHEQ